MHTITNKPQIENKPVPNKELHILSEGLNNGAIRLAKKISKTKPTLSSRYSPMLFIYADVLLLFIIVLGEFVLDMHNAKQRGARFLRVPP